MGYKYAPERTASCARTFARWKSSVAISLTFSDIVRVNDLSDLKSNRMIGNKCKFVAV